MLAYGERGGVADVRARLGERRRWAPGIRSGAAEDKLTRMNKYECLLAILSDGLIAESTIRGDRI